MLGCGREWRGLGGRSGFGVKVGRISTGNGGYSRVGVSLDRLLCVCVKKC